MTTSTTAGDWLHAAVERLLDASGGEKTRNEAALEAQVLLAHGTARPRAWLLAHPEHAIPGTLLESLEGQLDRLGTGVPLPYLTGRQEFYGMEFEVNSAVLIPRPETELLVETALAWLAAHPGARWAADVGTGSGCIAAVLARRVPRLRLAAVDCSRDALRVARRNLKRHALLKRVSLVQGDLLTSCNGPFDLVCANLPYIPSTALDDLPVVRYEPRSALDGGTDGLDLIRVLLIDLPRLLAHPGLALLEIEATQGDTAAAQARACFPNAVVRVLPDLAGLPRLLTVVTGDHGNLYLP